MIEVVLFFLTFVIGFLSAKVYQVFQTRKNRTFSVKSALLWAIDPSRWDQNVSDEEWKGMTTVATSIQAILISHWDDPELQKEFGYDRRLFMGREIPPEDGTGIDSTG